MSIKCGKKACEFDCKDPSLSVSRSSVQCKKEKYKIGKQDSKTVNCSSDPPCGPIEESFDYDKEKITVTYHKLGKSSLNTVSNELCLFYLQQEPKITLVGKYRRPFCAGVLHRFSETGVFVH